MDIIKLKDAIIKTNDHSNMSIIDNAGLNLSCANGCSESCSPGCSVRCAQYCVSVGL